MQYKGFTITKGVAGSYTGADKTVWHVYKGGEYWETFDLRRDAKAWIDRITVTN